MDCEQRSGNRIVHLRRTVMNESTTETRSSKYRNEHEVQAFPDTFVT